MCASDVHARSFSRSLFFFFPQCFSNLSLSQRAKASFSPLVPLETRPRIPIRNTASKWQRSRNLYYKSECTCAPTYSEIPVLAGRNERSFYFDDVFQFSGFCERVSSFYRVTFARQQIKDEDESRGEEEGEKGANHPKCRGGIQKRETSRPGTNIALCVY